WGAAVVPLLIGAVETCVSGFLAYVGLEHHWLAYTSSWLLCARVGSALILRRGLKQVADTRPAAGWPRAKLALGFAAAAALHLITFWNMDTAVRLMLSSVRMEAGAMAMAAAPPRVPDNENAAFVYEKAFALMKRITTEDARLKALYEKKADQWYWKKGFDKPDFNTDDADLREFLTRQQPTTALLKRAAAMPGCYFERGYAQLSLDTQLPELASMRECARLLAAEARCKAADGQVRAALENVAAIRGMSRHVAAEPILISGLVSVAIDEIALRTLQGILTTTTPTVADLAVVPADETVSFQRVLRRCLNGEEAFGLSAFAMLSSDTPTQELSREVGADPRFFGPVLGAPWRVFLLPDDLEGYRRQMKTLRDMAQVGFKDALARSKKLEDENAIRRAGILSAFVLPALSRCYIAFARAEARHRLAEAALATAAYRAKTGQFPAKLEGLVPDYLAEVPLDPYDEQPLRFRPTASAVTVYSIGEDLVDDGGATESDTGTEKGDIVFRVGSVPTAAPAGK
ncbi:MAG: hypothetical protein NTW87_21400, partial [Planctomycetota bacterium]|nr:hypothetical protein [Planctomycetota bacterium]